MPYSLTNPNPYYSPKPQAEKLSLVCIHCKDGFRTWRPNQKYCSTKCRKLATLPPDCETTIDKRSITGAANELIVCVDLLRKGFEVFRNVAAVGVDLMAYKAPNAYRVEVKTTTRNTVTGTLYLVAHHKDKADIVAFVHKGEITYLDSKTKAPVAF